MPSILSVLPALCKDSDTDHKNKTRLLRTKEWPERQKRIFGRTFWARCCVNDGGADFGSIYRLGYQLFYEVSKPLSGFIPKNVGVKYEVFHKRLESGGKGILSREAPRLENRQSLIWVCKQCQHD